MKVYFKNSQGKERLIGTTDNDKQAMKIIHNFCDERSFYIPYTRYWTDPNNLNRTIVDVSSHTEFFIIEEEQFN